MGLKLDSKLVGTIIESEVFIKLSELGFDVFTPFMMNHKTDCIIKKGNRCINIQIKTGIRCYNPKWSEDRWRAELKRKDRKARRLNYDKKDCDFFIVKCRGYDAYYIFPYSCCKETNTVQLYPHRDKQVHQGFDAEPYKNAWELLERAI